MPILEIQKYLKHNGFDPGPLDGVFGRLTIAAVRAFQRRHDLAADGIVDPLTARALGRSPGVGRGG